MENQHRQIKGYRELSQGEIDLMNRVKEQGLVLERLIDDVRQHVARQRTNTGTDSVAAATELVRMNTAEPERWASIARTHFQEGLMALTRSVAQPGFF